MRRRLALWCAAVAALLIDDVGPMPAPLPPPPPPPALPAVAPVTFTAVTFNAGLAPGMVPLANERAPAVAAAVAVLPDDVLCLQELWRPEHEQLVLAALGLPAAHVFRFDSAGLGVNPAERCEAGALAGLAACAERACGDADAEDQSRCVATNCRGEMRSLYLRQRDCLECAVSGTGQPLKEVVATCEGKGMSRVYGGRNGVLLASRWPLRSPSALVLPSSRANRVALFARVEVPKSAPVEIACTHLSVPLPIEPDHQGFPSWEAEQAAQARMVSDQLAVRAQDGVPQVLLADINAGPAFHDVKPRSALAWETFARAGFACGSLLLPEPRCTSCPENPLRPGEEPFLLDHGCSRQPHPLAASRWVITPVAAERLFTAPVQVTARDGTPVRTVLSDHYGLRVTFDIR